MIDTICILMVGKRVKFTRIDNGEVDFGHVKSVIKVDNTWRLEIAFNVYDDNQHLVSYGKQVVGLIDLVEVLS